MVAAAKTLAEVEQVVVDIERLVFGGEGLGRYQGVPIFVPRSAPGEKLLVKLVERRTGWGRAEIVEILEASPERREAPRPYFERCGGCDLQHLEDAAQLRHKSAAVLESLVRQGGVEIPKDALEVISADAWAYRTRTQLHVAASDRGREVGYFARNSHQLVAVDVCPILVPELEKQLPSLPRLVRDERHERVDLTSGDDHRITCSPPVENLPHGSVERTIQGFRYEIDARVFFQSHRQLAEKLVEVAIGEESDPEGEAYDLYAGVGLFSLPLGKRYRQVVAVEGDRVASRFAKRNVKANGLENVAVEALSVDSFASKLPKNVARVVVDPPRVGLSATVRRALLIARPRYLTYVSCHAPTLARDLRELLTVYRLEKLSLLDMFPQTGHMEVVVQLRLSGGILEMEGVYTPRAGQGGLQVLLRPLHPLRRPRSRAAARPQLPGGGRDRRPAPRPRRHAGQLPRGQKRGPRRLPAARQPDPDPRPQPPPADRRTAAGGVEVRFHDRRYVFPEKDVLLLPIANTSVELFARMLWQELVAKVPTHNLEALGVRVAETAGQSCWFRAPVRS